MPESYLILKKIIWHATADVGMIFTAYNLRRIFNKIYKNTWGSTTLCNRKSTFSYKDS